MNAAQAVGARTDVAYDDSIEPYRFVQIHVYGERNKRCLVVRKPIPALAFRSVARAAIEHQVNCIPHQSVRNTCLTVDHEKAVPHHESRYTNSRPAASSEASGWNVRTTRIENERHAIARTYIPRMIGL